MRLLGYVLPLLSLCAASLALHESDVGVTDWYKQLIGVPAFESPSTAPSFHRTGDQEIIVSGTSNNVLAALRPENGTVLWRYIFDKEDKLAGYYKDDGVIATLSGPGGVYLRLFDSLTGSLIIEKRLHASSAGVPSEPFYQGKDVAFSVDGAYLYVLTNGYTIQRIRRTTGEIDWAWTSPDQSSLVLYSKLVVSSDTVYGIGVAKSFASYTLHIASLSPSTGEVTNTAHVSSSINHPLKELAILSRKSLPNPVVLWLEQGALRYVTLNPTLKVTPVPIKGEGYVGILDIGLNSQGQAVVTRQNGSSFVLRLEGEVGHGKTIWEFSDPVASGGTPPAYHGAVDGLGRPYVAQVYWSHAFQKLRGDVFASQFGTVHGFALPFDLKNDGIPSHIAISSYYTSESTVEMRFLITTTTGAIQLWDQNQLKWSREESLASISIAEFVELPEKQAAESENLRSDEGFTSRIFRHLVDAQSFPQYLVAFTKRFVTGSYANPSSPISSASEGTYNLTESLSRDTFGFRQVIIVASPYGKVFALDSSNGKIIWSRVLSLGWAGSVGGKVIPVHAYVVKTVSDGGQPEVVLVAARKADNGLVDTVIFHFNAVTGADILGELATQGALQGFDIIQGYFVSAHFLNLEDKKMVVLVDEFLQLYTYPESPANRDVFNKIASNLSFPIRMGGQDRITVMGHKIVLEQDSNRKPLANTNWVLNFPLGEEVIDTVSPSTHGPIASFGKVLGNRTTLYKYLNSRLFTVLTSNPTRSTCGLYLVDGAKGTINYQTEVKQPIGGCNIKTFFVENWLVYHYYESEVADGTVGGAKGWRMVSVELYEGQKVDEKIRSSEISSSSNDTLNFSAYERSWVFPFGITAIAPTQTKFGITTKDVIVATSNHRVQSFPHRLLDPRRPSRKVTTEEQEEFLIQYDPILHNDPRRVLSHSYQVANVRKIVAAPALLESTSLVFAYGLDLFLTRVAPSNTFDVLSENFNKAQLVFTVSGLILAIAITKPMVQRKRLREKWYQS